MKIEFDGRGRHPRLIKDSKGVRLLYQKREAPGHVLLSRPVTGGPEIRLSAVSDLESHSAVLINGQMLTVWSQFVDGRYLLVADFAGQPLKIMPLPAGPMIQPCLTAGPSGAALVYQGVDAKGFQQIYFQEFIKGAWSAPVSVGIAGTNNWCPAAAWAPDGYGVVWDCYASGAYAVYFRQKQKGQWGEACCLSPEDCFNAHANIAADGSGRLWVAWNRGTPDWGKDNQPFRNGRILEYNYLHVRRFLEVRCLENGVWQTLAPDLQADVLDVNLPGQHYERPQLFADPDGCLYLMFRYNVGEPKGGHRNEKRWQAMMTSYNGNIWTLPVEIEGCFGQSTGGLALTVSDGKVYMAAAGEGPSSQKTEMQTTVRVVSEPLIGTTAVPPRFFSTARVQASPAAEARPARYQTTHHGEKWGLFYGDLHRHTEFSFCRTSIDGSLEEVFRYARDAAQMDFVMSADHDKQAAAPDLWFEVMQAADRYNSPGQFTTFFGYEWIGASDNKRHRNIVSARRVPPPPFTAKNHEGVDQRDIRDTWATLERGRAITLAHHTSSNMFLLWNEHPGEAVDPEMEPLVEIFQSSRGSSEYIGAPTLAGHFTRSGQYEKHFSVEKGTVAAALRSGIRMGFVASSDHMSTHQSYACVYASENTRESLMAAMIARRTFAASDRIICEFWLGDAFMGEVKTGGETLIGRIRFIGTGPIREVTLLRDSVPWRSWYPVGHSCELEFQIKPDELAGHYFYTRMQQEDTNLAWSSPIWIE